MAYHYTKIKDLESNRTKVNVFGVVKYFRPPSATKMYQYNALYTLIDPSVDDLKNGGIRCNLFAVRKEELPLVNIGDVIRFHRTSVTTFNNKLQIQGPRGYSWLVFGAGKDVNNPLSSHANPTITDEDKNHAQKLHNFFNQIKDKIPELNKNTQFTNLCDVGLEMFFNCKVKVLSVHMFEDSKNHCVLQITDGTKVKYSSFRHQGVIDFTESNVLNVSWEYIYDVSLFDDHVADVKNVKSGDFIELFNVHAKKICNDLPEQLKDSLPLNEINGSQGWVELVVHTGKRHGQGVKVISCLQEDSFVKNICERVTKLPRQIRKNEISVQSFMSNVPSFTKTDFPTHPISTLKSVHQSNVPFKFKIKVKVIGVYPENLKTFVIGICKTCEHAHTDVYKETNIASLPCLNCKRDILELSYYFKILIMDSTGLLDVNVHGHNALQFFNKTYPVTFLSDSHIFTNINEKFSSIVGSELVGDLINKNEIPFVDMCIYSFTVNGTTKYNLFGTSLI